MFLLNLVPVVIYFYFCIIKSPFMNTGCALVSAGAWIEVLFAIVLFATSALLNLL